MLGPDHALARRDGQRREGDGAPRDGPAAADRRRDDVAAAHGGADRARSTRASPCPRDRRLARGRRRVVAARPRRARPSSTSRTARCRRRCARSTRSARSTPLLPYRMAIEHRTPIEWRAEDVPAAVVHGHPRGRAHDRRAPDVHRLDVLLHRLGAEGALPADPRPSEARRRRRASSSTTAKSCWTRSRTASCCRRAACSGSGRRNAEGDDIVLDNGMVFPMLRQQTGQGRRPARTARLADFVAPAEIGLPDHIGAFAVTAGLGADDLVKRFEAEHDDYRAIMVKALADRLAEAFAEQLHQQARIAWGYQDDAAAERGAGRREVPRHPAGVRLPGVPRPQPEASSVRSARQRARSASTSPTRSR